MLPIPPRPDQDKEPLLPDRESEYEEGFDGEEPHEEDYDDDGDDGSEEDGDHTGPNEPLEEKPDDGDEDDLITVATFRTAPEAELAKTALDGEGIESYIADAETVTMDWLLGIAVGDVKVQVARRVSAQAREFLARSRKPHEEEETPGTATCLSCGALFPEDADNCPACGWSFEGTPSGD